MSHHPIQAILDQYRSNLEEINRRTEQDRIEFNDYQANVYDYLGHHLVPYWEEVRDTINQNGFKSQVFRGDSLTLRIVNDHHRHPITDIQISPTATREVSITVNKSERWHGPVGDDCLAAGKRITQSTIEAIFSL